MVLLSLLLLLDGFLAASAITASFNVIHSAGASNGLQRRTSLTGTPVANTQNAFYVVNITLGGQTKRVMIDTGSSDLWVTGDVSATDTGSTADLHYAVGEAKGNIQTADLVFDNYTISNQAFLHVTDTSTFSANITSEGYDGLIGLGPNSGSVIHDDMDKGSAGDTVLSRIFEQNKTTQNFISFLLDRRGDPTEPFTGQLTISETVSGLENITAQPKLDVRMVHKLTDEDQHWQTLLDKNGIIGPDGQVISTSSIVPGVPSGQLVAVFDSGYTLPQVPRSVSDAIYGRVQGAIYNANSELWEIPCDQELNIAFVFGGVTFPIHPLDTNSDDFAATDPTGNPICIGAFQPITSAFSLLGEYDLILGMSYLRNAYTLLDFGDFVSGSSSDTGNPFIQMLPLTDVASAHTDFVSARLNGVDTTGSSGKALLPASQGQHSPETAAEKKAHREEMVLKYWPYIFAGAMVVFLAIVVCICWRCCKRRRARKVAKEARQQKVSSLLPVPVGGGYRQINDPAPQPGAMGMQPMGGYRDPYTYGGR